MRPATWRRGSPKGRADALEDRLDLGEQLGRSADHDRIRPGIGACGPPLTGASIISLAEIAEGRFQRKFYPRADAQGCAARNQAGHRQCNPMVLANVVRELFQTVINEHGADKDTQTLVKLFERNAGVAIIPQK